MKKLFFLFLIFGVSSNAAENWPRLEFNRIVAHWAEYDGPEYWEFIDAANPQVVQFGFFGGHFYSLAHTPQHGGYPAHFPVQGLDECGKWFKDNVRGLKLYKKRKMLVVGHFNVGFLVGDPDGPDGPRGFFKWYRDLWDEEVLGPKPPVEDPIEFLEKNRDGSPRATNTYKIGGMKEYFACLRNPHWQTVLKAWLKAGVDKGVDGLIANYFYRHDCHCQHCQKVFREYLSVRHTPKELQEKFAIQDLAKHEFDEIVCWHKPEESTPLRREMLRWSQISNKEAFDNVFHEYGRSLKHDLITGQWNHLSDFSQIRGDERCLLPTDLWGKDESYIWYSMGGSGVHTDLKNGVLADGTLQARYIRGAFDDKPFTLGKYEGVRIRAAISELAANGGAPMGFYARTRDPEAREIFEKYYGFLDQHQHLYHANQPQGEVVLLYPRKAVWEGNLQPLAAFKEAGKDLLNRQILFDVLPDDLEFKKDLSRYTAIVRYQDGKFEIPEEVLPKLTKIEAPDHVRVAANKPAGGGEIDLHFVNYNRVELPRNNGRPNPGHGAADENPIPVDGITVDFAIPEGEKVLGVEVLEPEQQNPQKIRFKREGNRLKFSMPVFRVYSVARIKVEPLPPGKLLKIAGITTEYRRNSHADVILGKLIETDTLDGQGYRHPVRMTSLYTDQVPDNDKSRELAQTHKFKIHDSITNALTNGTGKRLAVDGVMLVVEHGDYPMAEDGQFWYPKRKMFEEVVEVFDQSKRVVPIFFDKHLSDNWEEAKWIYDTAKEKKIPMLAGSSIPKVWRYPPVDVKRGAKLKEIVAINYGHLDSYGFHALEMVQSLVERRAGGETGVKRVRCITGEEVWTTDLYDRNLLEEAMARVWNHNQLRGDRTLEQRVLKPVLFVFDYKDGLRASILTLNGAVAEWAAAWKYADDSKHSVESTLFWVPEARPFYGFSRQVKVAVSMFQTGKTPWPLERTLLTSGALDAAFQSKLKGGEWLETPWLDIVYNSDWEWTQPDPPPHPRPIHGNLP